MGSLVFLPRECLETRWISKSAITKYSFTQTHTYQSEHTSQSNSPYWSYQLHPQSCWPWNIKKITTKEKKVLNACSLFAPHNVIRQATLSAWEKQERRSSLLAAVGCCYCIFSHIPPITHTLVCMIASFVLDSCMHASTYLNKAIWRLCNRVFSLCTTYTADREVTQWDLTQSICACKAWFI